MDYTDAMIRRLRDRLMRYRTENRIGGRKRPWHRVAQDIADAESVPREFYDREDNFDVLGEALRRFEAGLQVPSRERLDAIRAFLIEKRYLDPDAGAENDDDPRHLFAAVGSLLTGAGRFVAEGQVEGSYLAVRQQGGRYDYRIVSVTAAGDDVWTIDDAIYKTAMPARTSNPADLRRILKVASTVTMRSDGWAVLAPNGHMMALCMDRLTRDWRLAPLVLPHPEDGFAEAGIMVLVYNDEPASGEPCHGPASGPDVGHWVFAKQVNG